MKDDGMILWLQVEIFLWRLPAEENPPQRCRKELSLFSLHIQYRGPTHFPFISLTTIRTIIITSIYLASYQRSPSYTSRCLLSHSRQLVVYIIKPSSPSRRILHLFTFTHVAKITRDLPFFSVSHLSLYNPLGSTCAHSPRLSSDTLAETSNTSAWTFFSDGNIITVTLQSFTTEIAL